MSFSSVAQGVATVLGDWVARNPEKVGNLYIDKPASTLLLELLVLHLESTNNPFSPDQFRVASIYHNEVMAYVTYRYAAHKLALESQPDESVVESAVFERNQHSQSFLPMSVILWLYSILRERKGPFTFSELVQLRADIKMRVYVQIRCSDTIPKDEHELAIRDITNLFLIPKMQMDLTRDDVVSDTAEFRYLTKEGKFVDICVVVPGDKRIRVMTDQWSDYPQIDNGCTLLGKLNGEDWIARKNRVDAERSATASSESENQPDVKAKEKEYRDPLTALDPSPINEGGLDEWISDESAGSAVIPHRESTNLTRGEEEKQRI